MVSTDVAISIIVPIYNAEEHLSKCIDSILMQSFQNYELILVNDACSDSSKKICLNYALSDNRIIYLENDKNSGVSATRNKGIEIAKGKYIMFCDNDDIVAPLWIEHLLEVVRNEKSILPISAIAENLQDLGREKKLGIGDSAYSVKDYYSFNEAGIAGYIWNTLYRRDIIIKNRIRFKSRKEIGDINEDLLFSLDYIQHIDKIKYTGYADYLHENSGTNHGNWTDCKYYFEKYREKFDLWLSFILTKRSDKFSIYNRTLSTNTLYHFLNFFSINKSLNMSSVKNIVCSEEMRYVLQNGDISQESTKIIWLLRGKHYILLYLLLQLKTIRKSSLFFK